MCLVDVVRVDCFTDLFVVFWILEVFFLVTVEFDCELTWLSDSAAIFDDILWVSAVLEDNDWLLPVVKADVWLLSSADTADIPINTIVSSTKISTFLILTTPIKIIYYIHFKDNLFYCKIINLTPYEVCNTIFIQQYY